MCSPWPLRLGIVILSTIRSVTLVRYTLDIKVMSKESLVFVLGVLVLLVPFLGIPRDYKDWMLVVCGSLLILFGYQLRRKRFLASLVQDGKEGERKSDAFTESSIETQSLSENQRTGGLAL